MFFSCTCFDFVSFHHCSDLYIPGHFRLQDVLCGRDGSTQSTASSWVGFDSIHCLLILLPSFPSGLLPVFQKPILDALLPAFHLGCM